MKRLIAAFVLLTIVLTAFIVSFCITEDYYEEAQTRLTECIKEYKNGNKKTAADLAAELEDYFHKKESILIVFLNRGLIDEIAESTIRLLSYAKTQNDDMFFCESELCLHLIADLRRTDRYLVY